MTILVLLILAAIWAAVLVPPVLRARAEGSPADSIGSFRHQLSVLRRTGGPGLVVHQHTSYPGGHVEPVGTLVRQAGVAHVAPMVHYAARPMAATRPASRAVKRRRDIFCGLLAGVAGTSVLGLIPGLRSLWTLTMVLTALLAAYVVLLVQMRNAVAERDMKVRFLPQPARHTPEPALLLARRSAN